MRGGSQGRQATKKETKKKNEWIKLFFFEFEKRFGNGKGVVWGENRICGPKFSFAASFFTRNE